MRNQHIDVNSDIDEYGSTVMAHTSATCVSPLPNSIRPLFHESINKHNLSVTTHIRDNNMDLYTNVYEEGVSHPILISYLMTLILLVNYN